RAADGPESDRPAELAHKTHGRHTDEPVAIRRDRLPRGPLIPAPIEARRAPDVVHAWREDPDVRTRHGHLRNRVPGNTRPRPRRAAVPGGAEVTPHAVAGPADKSGLRVVECNRARTERAGEDEPDSRGRKLRR